MEIEVRIIGKTDSELEAITRALQSLSGTETVTATLEEAVAPSIMAWPEPTTGDQKEDDTPTDEQPEVDPVAALGETPPVFVPPTTGTVPPPPAAPEVELDEDGLPWDARIHAGTKTKTKTGIWKAKKGVGADLVEQVKAELKAAMSAPVPPVANATTPPPAATTPPPAATTPPPAAGPMTFADLVKVITQKQAAHVLTVEDVGTICQSVGVAQLPVLAARPDLIPAVYSGLEAIWLTRE